MSDPLTVTIEKTVGIIELSRPEKMNSLTEEMIQAMDRARADFEADKKVRAILIQAQGKNFCTGASLDELEKLRQSPEVFGEFTGNGHGVLLRFEESPLPVIVAVQGLCLAGGIELMLAADICFAAKTARIGDQHSQYGLVPGWGGSQRLPRIVGLRRALDLMFSARWMDAEEAKSFGLVNHIVADDKLHAEAFAYCEKLATRSRGGIAGMKRLARQGLELPIAAGLRLERDAAVLHMQTEDMDEGLAAFQARRTPEFK